MTLRNIALGWMAIVPLTALPAVLIAALPTTASAQGWCCGPRQTTYYPPAAPVTSYYAPQVTGFAPHAVGYAPQVSYYAPQTANYAPQEVNVAPQTANYVPQTYYRPTIVNLPVTSYQPVRSFFGLFGGQNATAYRPVTYYVNQVQWTPYTSYRVEYGSPAVTYPGSYPASAYPAQAYPAPTYSEPSAAPAPSSTYVEPAPSSTYQTPLSNPTPADSSLSQPSLLNSPGLAPIPTYQDPAPLPGAALPGTSAPPPSAEAPIGGPNDGHSASLPLRRNLSYGYERPRPIPSPLLSAEVKDHPRPAADLRQTANRASGTPSPAPAADAWRPSVR